MRRRYAFEAEGMSEEVKSQLEKVEDVVDSKCNSTEDCQKILDKIGAEEDKFNGALKDMAGAAKDCKDGKCDKAEMAAKISPKMAELKEVAKSIGVATEGDALTEQELKDAKAYLEGAKEIVESKMDEVGGEEPKDEKPAEDDKDDDKGAEGKKDEEPAEGGEDEEELKEADESFFADVPGMEAYTLNGMESVEDALESMILDSYIAMEGYNWDKRKEYKAKVKEVKDLVNAAKAAAKAGNAAEVKSNMDKAIKDLEEFRAGFKTECAENQDALSAICGYFAACWRTFGLALLMFVPVVGLGAYAEAIKEGIGEWVTLIQAITKKEKLNASDFNLYTKSMEHNMDIMIGHYKKVASKLDAKAIANAAKKAPAEETAPADESFFMDISALEGYTLTDMASCEAAVECAVFDCGIAMEGYNWDKRKEYNAKVKETKAKVKAAKAAAKAGDAATAKKNMEDVISDLQDFKKAFVDECAQNQTALDAVCGYFAYGWRAYGLILLSLIPTLGLGAYAVALKHDIEFWVGLIQAITKKEGRNASDFNIYTKSMEHNMDLMIGHYKKVAAKIDAKALAKAEKKGDDAEKAEESDLSFDGFINACESAMIAGKAEEPAPYLFD